MRIKIILNAVVLFMCVNVFGADNAAIAIPAANKEAKGVLETIVAFGAK